MKSNIISAYIFASDLKKSAIKRIMKDLGYEGCDPARFGLDDPDTIVAMITYQKEEGRDTNDTTGKCGSAKH